jgi:hypothetical protein
MLMIVQGDVRLRVETEKKLVGLGRKILAADAERLTKLIIRSST